MSQFEEYYKPIEFVLHFHFVKEDKSRTDKIYNQLSKEKRISVASISPKDIIYEVMATFSTMKRIFNSLEHYIETGVSMGYYSQDRSLCDNFVRYKNEAES